MDIPAEWTFRSDGVAAGFDTHVREQLPWYDLASDALVSVVRHYLPHNGIVYDIGASTGNIGRRLAPLLASREARLIGIEESPAFVADYDAPGELVTADAVTHKYEPFDVAVCFLSLVFISPERRECLIQTLHREMRPFGAVVIVERFLPEGSAYSGLVTARMTLAGKLDAGVSADDILKKELSLIGVQRPLARTELPEDAYEWFRMGDFAGYVIEGGAHG